MTSALVATLLLVTWPPTWTPDDKQIVQSFSQPRPIARYTVTAKTDVYNDGAVVITLSHKDVSRPIVVLRPSTTRCDPYYADMGVFQEGGVRFRPPPEWDAPSWKWTIRKSPECQETWL